MEKTTRAIFPPLWLRLVIAAILLAAAFMKAHQLATQPLPDGNLLDNRWFLLAGVLWEFFLAATLLTGFARRLTWLAATVTFFVFTAVTLYRGLIGDSSCGCFGTVEINPWITLTLDILLLVLLLAFHPSPLIAANTADPAAIRLTRRGFLLRTVPATVFVIIAGTIAVIGAVNYRPAALSDSGQIVGENRFVLLNPTAWLNKPFPLAPHIQLDRPFMQGNWVLVLHRRNCQDCEKLMPEVKSLAITAAADAAGIQIAVVEMPPYSPPDSSLAVAMPNILHGRLSAVRDWFAATPLVVGLCDGHVVFAQDSANALALRRATYAAANGGLPSYENLPPELDEPPPCCGESDTDDTWFYEQPEERQLLPLINGQGRYDIGRTTTGAVHFVDFEITNDRPEPLNIIGINSECSCLKVAMESHIIPPDSAGRILLGFKAPAAAVNYTARLLLETGSGNDILLTVTADVMAAPPPSPHPLPPPATTAD